MVISNVSDNVRNVAYVICRYISDVPDVTIHVRWMPVQSTSSMYVDFQLEGERVGCYSNKIHLRVYDNSPEITVERNVYLQYYKENECVPAESLAVVFEENDSVDEIHIATPTMLCLVQPNGNFYVAASGDDICENVSCTIIKVSGHIVEL